MIAAAAPTTAAPRSTYSTPSTSPTFSATMRTPGRLPETIQAVVTATTAQTAPSASRNCRNGRSPGPSGAGAVRTCHCQAAASAAYPHSASSAGRAVLKKRTAGSNFPYRSAPTSGHHFQNGPEREARLTHRIPGQEPPGVRPVQNPRQRRGTHAAPHERGGGPGQKGARRAPGERHEGDRGEQLKDADHRVDRRLLRDDQCPQREAANEQGTRTGHPGPRAPDELETRERHSRERQTGRREDGEEYRAAHEPPDAPRGGHLSR